jgi:hypothetical protein
MGGFMNRPFSSMGFSAFCTIVVVVLSAMQVGVVRNLVVDCRPQSIADSLLEGFVGFDVSGPQAPPYDVVIVYTPCTEPLPPNTPNCEFLTGPPAMCTQNRCEFLH